MSLARPLVGAVVGKVVWFSTIVVETAITLTLTFFRGNRGAEVTSELGESSIGHLGTSDR